MAAFRGGQDARRDATRSTCPATADTGELLYNVVINAYRTVIQWLGGRRVFARFFRPALARLDRLVYRATGGRFAPTGTVAPVLLLTTTGRRSGKPRTTPVMYVRAGEGFVVSSEDFGEPDRRAAWPLNLDAEPRALVEVKGVATWCESRRLTDAEADRYWPQLVSSWPAHEHYLERTGRRHTFMLTPLRDELQTGRTP